MIDTARTFPTARHRTLPQRWRLALHVAMGVLALAWWGLPPEAGVAHAQAPAAGVNGPLWYGYGGQPVGPIDGGDIAAAVRAGLIGPDTLVWMPGMAEWRPAREVPALSGLLAGAAAPTPPTLPTQQPPAGGGPSQGAPGSVDLGPMRIELGTVEGGEWRLGAAGQGQLEITNLDAPDDLLWRAITPKPPHARYRLSVTVAVDALDGADAEDLVTGAGLYFDGTDGPHTFRLFLAGPGGMTVIGRYDGDALSFPTQMSSDTGAARVAVRLAVEVDGQETRFLADGAEVATMTSDARRGPRVGIAATGAGRFVLSDFRYEPL